MATTLTLALTLTPVAGRGDGLPDMGDTSQGAVSPQVERTVGQQIFNDIRNRETDYVDDPEITGYLAALVGRLSGHVEGGLSDVTGSHGFEVFALRDPTLNAFALPGGYIGVHTGLILSAQSESELASVLAHEMSHVTQHHIARGVGASGVSQLATLVSMAVAILAARSSSDAAIGAMMTGQAIGIQNQLNYSRDFEREADRLGLQLLSRAGFDIRAMPVFFERMQKNSAIYENNAPAYLRTHPLTTERIAAVSDRIQGQPYKQVADSLEFQLVRARLRSLNGSVPETVTEFQVRLQSATAEAALVAHYGLARTWLRDGNIVAAQREATLVERLAKTGKQASPMLETLAAEVLMKRGDPAAAARRLSLARAHYPRDRAINYLLVDAYLLAGQAGAALDVARDDPINFGDDPRMRALEAQAYAALGQRTLQHRAQAESYVLRGSVPLALEQLELAKKAGDADFYGQSQVDARMRELRVRQLELLKELRR